MKDYRIRKETTRGGVYYYIEKCYLGTNSSLDVWEGCDLPNGVECSEDIDYIKEEIDDLRRRDVLKEVIKAEIIDY